MKAYIMALGVVILCGGCGTTAKFIYPAKVGRLIQLSEKPKYEKEVAVIPFDEMRGDRNVTGTYLLYLIPLMPFGFAEHERPDAARGFLTIYEFDFSMSEDLAKAAASSIRKSGIFKDCYFTFGGEKSRADLVLSGQVRSTTYKGTIYSYGLSVFAPCLWFLGLPSGSSRDELTMSLELRDVKTNEMIWEYSFDRQMKIVQGLYYHYGHDVSAYAELMQQAMNEALLDLDKTLQSRDRTVPGW